MRITGNDTRRPAFDPRGTMEATIAAIQRTKEMNTFMSASSQHVTPSAASQDSEEQPLEQRVDNRSQRPDTEAFRAFMASGWAAPAG